MTVEINNHPIKVAEDCKSLAQLLEKEGFTGMGQAVAVNNRVVPRSQWGDFQLTDGAKIIIIRAVCGG
ncbi:MAG: sulfur carrier protein ThiS [Muribaculaceae bacterium]|jgi:sulfur carrier protein